MKTFNSEFNAPVFLGIILTLIGASCCALCETAKTVSAHSALSTQHSAL
jgi:hypothetical protein